MANEESWLVMGPAEIAHRMAVWLTYYPRWPEEVEAPSVPVHEAEVGARC